MRQILLGLFLLLTPLRAEADGAALALALGAIDRGDFASARQAAQGMNDPIERDIVIWSRLRAAEGRWQEYRDFLARNPDWPGLALLRTKGEAAIPGDADPAAIIAYFDPAPPTTGAGALALALAHQARGDDAAAAAEAIRAWTTLTMTGPEAVALRGAFGAVLNAGRHHIARLDHLLWDGAEERARAMLPLVPEGWQRLAEARLALRADLPGVTARINAVPADLADDPGLAYERFLWRMRAGYWDTAGDLMAERSGSAESLGRPLLWASRRADLARDVMREGDFARCYRYAAQHRIAASVGGSAYADNEWLAGYCAYRLGRFDTAIGHFRAMRDAVATPISLGRAGYWLGRAEQAAGNPRAAADAFAFGARFQSSFYGQLAAERAGVALDPDLFRHGSAGGWRRASFVQSEVFHAALLLLEAGQDGLAARFLTHLTESLSPTEAAQLGDFALEIEHPHIAVRIAKRAADAGHEILRPGFPVVPALVGADLPAPSALIHAIARRESEFDPGVVSPAGALGLMQVMPGTGRDVARALGVPFSRDRMLSDPAYNALLGARYLSELIETHGGNPVLVAAAYNAGPRRTADWIARFGDPRKAADIVHWIEAIPFAETRNYIMRVAESMAIYEAQLTRGAPAIGLSQRLVR